MDILKTSIGISKTIKNVSRFREIINVLWRNGFDEFIIKSNLHKIIPGFAFPKTRIQKALDEKSDTENFWESVGFRLRKSFEELGPSFIKLGQLLATREDILDPALIKELKLLQNKVQGIEFGEARQIIERNIGTTIEETFLSLDEKPIGTASIGLAYKGVLKNGKVVVVKVRRPNIEKIISNDFEIIAFMVSQLEKVSNDFKYLGAGRAIDDFFKSTQLELNFLYEAQNCQKLKENLKQIDTDNMFVIPDIYSEYSSSEILVMDFLNGKPFNEIENLHSEDCDLEQMMNESVKMFIHTLLADGFFHADLHGGNFFLLENGKIGLIDFGLMGNLSKKNRTNLVAILLALVTNNYENLVYEFLDVADYENIPNHEELIRDLQDALSPFIGLSVEQMDVTLLVHSIVTTLSKHQMYLPREWFIIFRSLMTLDGVGKSIKIDLNIFEVIDSQIHDIMAELVSKESIMEDAMWIGRDTLNSIRIIPRHIKWMLKEFSKKKYRLDIQLVGVSKEINNISQSLYFIGLMFFTSTLTFCGVYLVKDITVSNLYDIPILAWIFWSLAFLSAIRGSFFLKSSK
jgi:ubiquinone biosynthesis protein